MPHVMVWARRHPDNLNDLLATSSDVYTDGEPSKAIIGQNEIAAFAADCINLNGQHWAFLQPQSYLMTFEDWCSWLDGDEAEAEEMAPISWQGKTGTTPSEWTVFLEVGGWVNLIYRINFYAPGSKSAIPTHSYDVEAGTLESLQSEAEDLARELGI